MFCDFWWFSNFFSTSFQPKSGFGIQSSPRFRNFRIFDRLCEAVTSLILVGTLKVRLFLKAIDLKRSFLGFSGSTDPDHLPPGGHTFPEIHENPEIPTWAAPLPLHRKHFPEVNKPSFCNSEHKKVISHAILKVKPCDFAQILRKFSDLALKSVISRFCMGGIPPRNFTQSRFFIEITSEIKRSRPVRIQDTKFYIIRTDMNKVMAKRVIRFILAKKNRI